MTSIDQLDPLELAAVRGLFTDIDDTLSTNGKITPDAYQALWDLHAAGLRVIVVTGRPAGWCDHIARFWPIDAVVGENGGFYFRHGGSRLVRRFIQDNAQRIEARRRLDAVRERILEAVPGCAVASEQPYRECDLAIDYCEDVPPLGREQARRIQTLFEEAGAHAAISSIHVNGWCGEFDKLSTSRLCMLECFGVDIAAENKAFVFCGDSPNDEPMFAFFKHSFAMANFTKYAGLVKHLPAYITKHPCGAGFRQVADLILHTRQPR